MQATSSDKAPLVVSFGWGVDSLAVLVGYAQRGIRPDLILHAEVGSEKKLTYEYQYLGVVQNWLARVGFPPITTVKGQTKRFKWGTYTTIFGNVMRNATLPSLAFRKHGCSMRWKIQVMDKFVNSWGPAKGVWGRGGKVRRVIGYDCSVQETRRFAHAQKKNRRDRKYTYEYPLRTWKWDRARCMEEIAKAGLPVPPKSACFFCPGSKAWELDLLTKGELKAIVAMEHRAAPGLEKIKGLWTDKTMTEHIGAVGLLERSEIARIQSICPTQKDLPQGTLEAFVAENLEGISL